MEMPSRVNRPRWVDLATDDPQAAQQFYGQLFGWQMDVTEDPQYGGYAMAMLGDGAAAGIGGKQDPNTPNVWSLYIGSDDLENLAERVTAKGGTVVVPPFEVGDQGRMAVFQDPGGAFISGWHGAGGGNFTTDEPGAFSWAELNARGVDAAAGRATELGATQLVAPEDFPGGRYAVLNDPQGAVFAVLKVTQDV